MGSKPTIAICGAGIGGLTAALALQARGFDVTVYEQAGQLGEVGAGLQLAANSVRILFALGLRERLLEQASIPEGKRVRLWSTGQTWPLFDLGAESEARYGVPYLMMHRADLHEVLRAAFEERVPGGLRLGHKLTGFDDSGASVTLAFADGTTARADLLIGADGVHSTIRGQMFGATKPDFSGCVAWRGVIPADRVAPHLRQPYGTNWIGPHGHVIQYPLRGGALVNFVGIVERDDWQVESWTHVGSVEECARDFEGWHEDVQALIAATDTPMKWALMLRPVLEAWSRGRATLLGDAAHPTLPFLAQGAGMAIEDGLVLARCLDARRDDVAGALAAYEAARHERTSAVVHGSSENARRFHNPTLAHASGAQRYVDVEWAPERVAERYNWLFAYDALRVAI